MLVEVVKSKIHRVTVTQADLNYIGSITIDEDLLDAANIIPNEKVAIVNNNNGERFETYVIKGERGSGMICLNGAAARCVSTGDKIIIMADADVDGAHISTLLLTLFYRFMPELIKQGYVYLAQPPLYKIEKNKKIWYAYDDKELDNILTEIGRDGNNKIQRYKGLGEMDAEQLWETTLDPERRLLKLVEIEDARMASEMTELLMGTDVPPRKAFIYDHATDAALDI